MGQKGTPLWSLRSSDLAPTNLYLWDHKNSIIYWESVNTRHELQRLIQTAATMWHTPRIFRCIRTSWCHSVLTLINGRHFQQRLLNPVNIKTLLCSNLMYKCKPNIRSYIDRCILYLVRFILPHSLFSCFVCFVLFLHRTIRCVSIVVEMCARTRQIYS